MAFEHYVNSNGRRLRCGYTTGTCAALAAAGAARLLLTGRAPETVRLRTPRGWEVEVPLVRAELRSPTGAAAAVVKDAGDDADVTAGALIVADVDLREGPGVDIDGGDGVGRVTRPGLDQPVGAAAINRVPRRMIAEELEALAGHLGYEGGFRVVIRVPGGQEMAGRTFNPKLGVEGGISILGTSGIVEPMSNQALVDTIGLEIRQAVAGGAGRLVLTPGNYGADFLAGGALLLPEGVPVVRCSNFVGEALDCARLEGVGEVLLVGHLGKLVKLAAGIMNTHSRWADGRMEVLCAHAALCGADRETARALMDSATTDRCLEVLDGAGLRGPVLASVLEAVQEHLDRRTGQEMPAGAVLFSNQFGLLGATQRGEEMLAEWNR